MSDDNGDVIDSFMPFNTLTEDKAEEKPCIVIIDDGSGTANRVGENLKIVEKITDDISEETTKSASKSDEQS